MVEAEEVVIGAEWVETAATEETTLLLIEFAAWDLAVGGLG